MEELVQEKKQPLFSRNALVRLIIPLIIEQLLLMTVGMADTVMVTTAGEAAVSGVSLVDNINTLIIQIFSALWDVRKWSRQRPHPNSCSIPCARYPSC